MESFLLDDVSSVIRNKGIERIISPMIVQLCHLLISMERKEVENEVFASLEMMAEELAKACEDFVQVAKRLAGDSEEEWLKEEMEAAAQSLTLFGRNITLVTQRLHLQPECQHHREELVTAAQQILVNTTKVLLLEDAAMARKMVRAAGWCLTCLDALEAAGDAASLRGPFADLAAALLRLGELAAHRPEERLGRAGRLLRGYVPPLIAAVRGHLRHPRDPQLAASRRRVCALARKALGELLVQLDPGTAAPAAGSWNGALARRLRQLHQLLVAPEPEPLHVGVLDPPLAAVVWHCMRLAACSAPPERLHLVARCGRLLQLRSAGARRLAGISGPPGRGQGRPEPGQERAALRAATEALFQGFRTGLLRQILDTFTDTQSPLLRLVQAAVATPYHDEALPKSLQLFLATFHDRAKQMLRVARLALVCCPRQEIGRDMEAAMAGVWGLVVRVQQLFSGSPQGSGRDWNPVTLQALLRAWARESEHLLACFDDVLSIPEFLSVSIQEMTKHLDFFTWALESGNSREFSRCVAYLQGRATHIAQVMSRCVGRERDPIFRNGLRVLIQQLEQSSSVLRAAAERCSHEYGSPDTDAFLTMAKHLIYSAQSLKEGLDGTNHPDILSPLRDQVHRSDIAKRQLYFILPSLQSSAAPELKYQRAPGLGENDPGTSYPPTDHSPHPLIPDTCPKRRDSPHPAISKLFLAVESPDHQAVASACTNLLEHDAAVGAAQEALTGEGPLGPERMMGLQGISTLAPPIIDLAKEIAHCTTARTDRLLEVALQLNGRTRETRQGLAAMAGDWYPLCQQLFCHNPTADLPESTAVFLELQRNVASLVQLAAKSGPMDLDKNSLDSTRHPEVLLQMQGRLKEAETHAKQLLDKVLAFDGLQAPKSWEESVEDGCLLWSVAVQDLLQYVEHLSGRKGLFLLPLRLAMKNQQGLQEGLDQAADVSQRLQEAARLSSLLCGDEQEKGEVSFLRREVHVLTDALLDVAQILASSPRPSPSLSTRFELLRLELTLQAKALTGHLSIINADYECAFQDVIFPRPSVCKDPQIRPESSLQRMVSGIQAVQEIVVEGQEYGPCQEDLLMTLESILTLTKEVAQRIPVLREYPEEWGMHILGWLRWEWAAKAHYAVTQLQAWKGGHTKAWRHLVQCLKPGEEPARAPEQDSIQPQFCEEDAAGATAMGSVDSQSAAPGTPLGSSVGTCIAEPAVPGTATVDPSMTKDQLITSARKIATSGQDFAKLICIIAKNCRDQRCSQELLCAVEQVQTMSNQLRIISSVKASLARSKSSEELLVENAQQLLQAVFKTMRAAEAASLRGLREPSPDPEELEVAAFCLQWRRKLLKHRLQETSNTACDELGLRNTSTKPPPTLATLVQEAV
uniref:Vinculin n=1 Tax=Papio anubis TaxID=9555 RepID=A0A8I5QZB5_PAPAN